MNSGAAQQISIPSEIPNQNLQLLVSNNIHIFPNVAENSNVSNSNGTRTLEEHNTDQAKDILELIYLKNLNNLELRYLKIIQFLLIKQPILNQLLIRSRNHQ
ncbi:unnamed protein product [Paramecium sonneborni]|uniref:Uncharacterized protein n=1 Tax=Paramecium sonneborni TaxID=65129 RepID=A0A8S1KLB7_9CILI|nr:unnamed protein product [Paramecium sonneborni]